MFKDLDFSDASDLQALLFAANDCLLYTIVLADDNGSNFSALATDDGIHDELIFVARLDTDRWFCGMVMPDDDSAVSQTCYTVKQVTTHASLAGALRWLTTNG